MDKNTKYIKSFVYFILSVLCVLFYITCSFTPVSKKDFMSFGQNEDKKDKKDKKNVDDPDPDPINNIIEIKSNSYTIAANGFFSFDTVDVTKREMPVTFTINNIGNNDLLLTGNPIISIDNSIDFEINFTDISNKGNKIIVDNSGTFTITFKSTVIDGKNKTANVSIKNNLGNDYNFTISCIAKRSGSQMITSSGPWLSPCYGTIIIFLAGGGGGGGGGSEDKGGGGGGAGRLEVRTFKSYSIGDIYTIVIGNGAPGGSGYVSGGRGDTSRFIDKNSIILLEAGGGHGGGGATDDNPGLGGELYGKPGSEIAGGDGGDFIFRGQFMGCGDGGENYDLPGESAPIGSGGGGGGGADAGHSGSDGGYGGSGFIYIEWMGFTN